MDETVKRFPPYLEKLIDHLSTMGICNYKEGGVNCAIIHKYDANAPGGPQGVFPHTDGPWNSSRVVILSLASPILMKFYPPITCRNGLNPTEDEELHEPILSLYLRPRSILVFSEELYRYYHGIEAVEVDTIPSNCMNASLVGVSVGDSLPRSAIPRVSVTLRQML